MSRLQQHQARENARPGRTRGSAGGFGLALVAAIGALALLAAAAQASTITVGSVLPTTFTATEFGKAKTQFNTALPEPGANLASPVDGAIVRWRVQGAKGGPFYLRVLRPNGKGAFEAVGTSLPATPADEGIQTFATNLRIHAGDQIGIDSTNATDRIGVAAIPGASFAILTAPLFEGATVPPSESLSGQEIELSAEVQPRPEITAVTPSSGSIAGGAKVTIAGSGFTAASAVAFGEIPAASFTVESDTEIKATVPASAKAGTVDVTATTLAGTSPTARADRFTYTACVVPKLKGKKLKPAKDALRRAGCRLGTVRGGKGKAAEVTKQGPKPHKVLAPGSKVNVTLGIEK